MTNTHGDFIWYELLTSDPKAAAGFYGSVLGWTMHGAGPEYDLFAAADGDVAGLMKLPDPAMKPVWLGYVGVDDVDAAAASVTERGGSVHKGPQDIPGVGRFAFVADPQGVMFYMMRGTGEQASRSFAPEVDGHCAWNELATTDQAAALDFYGRMFGWTKGDTMNMGDMGDYVFLHHGGAMLGAVMTRAADGPPAMWTFYFRVPDIDAATARARSAGGSIMHGPVEVPGGDHIIVGTDPQGALFALVGKKL